eukprot:10497977-Lingulodinium_polyedra.AAC.1
MSGRHRSLTFFFNSVPVGVWSISTPGHPRRDRHSGRRVDFIVMPAACPDDWRLRLGWRGHLSDHT